MNFSISKINSGDLLVFKKDMQEAFQKGFEEVYGKTNENFIGDDDGMFVFQKIYPAL